MTRKILLQKCDRGKEKKRMNPIQLNAITTAQAAQSIAMRHHGSPPEWLMILMVTLLILQAVLVVCALVAAVKGWHERKKEDK